MDSRTLHALLPTACGCLLLTGCGPGANSPVPPTPTAAKPDVIVTIDGERHTCLVALYREAQGSTVACDEVLPFVRDELRVPKGGTYDVRTLAQADKSEIAKVEAGLEGAGYRFIAGSRAGSN